MTSPLPQLQYLVGFANGPLDDNTGWTVGTSVAAGQWTDITSYVSQHTLSRGRQHELAQFEAGTLALELANQDQRFTPWYSPGPYAGLLAPLKQVQVRSVSGGTTFYRFTGHITAITPQWPDALSQFARIEASDAFRLLQQTLLVNNSYSATVLADGPVGYYRMSDPYSLAGTCVDFSGNGNNGTYGVTATNSLSFQQTGALPEDPDTACKTTNGYVSLPATVGNFGTGAFTIEAWVNCSVANGQVAFVSANDNVLTNFADLQLSNPFGFAAMNVAAENITGSTRLNDGSWHHLVCTRDGSGSTLTLYADGVQVGQLTGQTAVSITGSDHVGIAMFQSATPAFNGLVDEVAIYTTELSAARVTAHYNAGTQSLLQQSADTTIGAVLTSINWPANLRVLDAAVQTVAAATGTLTTTTALGHAQTVEKTEGGAMYMDARGRVRFVSRTNLYANGSPFNNVQAWFGDQINYGSTVGAAWGTGTWGGASTWGHLQTAKWGDTTAWDTEAWGSNDLPFEPAPDMALDDLDLVNRVTVGRSGGVAQTANDTASQGVYGLHSASITGLLHLSDAASTQHAAWLLAKLRFPQTRLRSIRTNMLDDLVNLPAAVLPLDLLYRISVERSEYGFQQTALIEHIQETVTADSWDIVLSLSATDVLANSGMSTGPNWAGAQ